MDPPPDRDGISKDARTTPSSLKTRPKGPLPRGLLLVLTQEVPDPYRPGGSLPHRYPQDTISLGRDRNQDDVSQEYTT